MIASAILVETLYLLPISQAGVIVAGSVAIEPIDCASAGVLEARTAKTTIGKTMAKKKIVRRAWTISDVRELKSLAKKKAGVAKISKALKRTIGATAVKAHQLGLSLDTRG